MEKKSVSLSGTVNGQSTESVSHSPASQSLATPKTNEKKSGVKPSSESELGILSPTVSKISPFPRATRSSQNPEFAAKQRKFLNRVHDTTRIIGSETSEESSTPVSSKHKKESKLKSFSSELKRKRENDTTLTPRNLAQEENEEGSSKKKKAREVNFFLINLKV